MKGWSGEKKNCKQSEGGVTALASCCISVVSVYLFGNLLLLQDFGKEAFADQLYKMLYVIYNFAFQRRTFIKGQLKLKSNHQCVLSVYLTCVLIYSKS